mmetsp:Transcript_6574/g.18875  ORF Transcript_6574/g.18875 Transcript_6574/m.18875 type:complete len:234 (-) Transcript_6574:1119-1820(-)
MRLFSSSMMLSRDSTISEIAELFCCREATAASSSWTFVRSDCRARKRVDLAISKASSRTSSSYRWVLLLLPPLPPNPINPNTHEIRPPLLESLERADSFRRCSVMRKSSMAMARSSASDTFSLMACFSSANRSLSSSCLWLHSLQRSCHSSKSSCRERMVAPSAVQLTSYSTSRLRSSAARASTSTIRSVRTSSWCLCNTSRCSSASAVVVRLSSCDTREFSRDRDSLSSSCR